ncbi:MAG: radical SAM protein [Erysipelotrichales bacterium]|nr:radical SAM protein [Erysipelotrichales bacterium]
MHYVEAKGILSSSNGMNVYRGCSHGCIYCDSRSTCYQMNHLFEDIEVKVNATTLLESKLRSKRKPCMIGTGSMCDPYLPLEKNLSITRKCLELIYQYGYGATVHTKSTLILRDIELLKKINEKTKCVVQMTLTTYDEKLCRIIEPNVASTKERLEVLMKCKEYNIPTVVWLSPILPYINDTLDNLKGILNYCKEANVYGIIYFGAGLTLREGNREYFYQKLDEHFPGLKEIYQKRYGLSYEIISPHHNELSLYFYNFCKEHHIVSNIDELFSYMHEFPDIKEYEQLQLF